MDESDYKEFERLSRPTQSGKKVKAYFKYLLRRQDFQKEIEKIRKKHGIKTLTYSSGCSIPPHGWKGAVSELLNDLHNLGKKFHLPIVDAEFFFEPYIFYNEVFFDVLEPTLGNLCQIADLKNESEEPFPEEFQDSNNENYPVAIRISPYASQRDVIDFVKKRFGLIEMVQKQYRKPEVKIAKIRPKRKDKQEIADIIWNNRHMTLSNIQNLLEQRSFFLDQAEIGKIKSLEKQRRQM